MSAAVTHSAALAVRTPPPARPPTSAPSPSHPGLGSSSCEACYFSPSRGFAPVVLPVLTPRHVFSRSLRHRRPRDAASAASPRSKPGLVARPRRPVAVTAWPPSPPLPLLANAR